MPKKFQHKKSLGQHFLTSDVIPKKMCDAADIVAGDVVLEIGPGTGVLTADILKRGASVVAVEADGRAIATLSETFPDAIARGELTVHHMDARTIDFDLLGLTDHSFKVVANIPYYISGLLFRQCLESTTQPTDLVFLVQKEVAQRIARSEKESILSQSVKVFGAPSYICTVKRGHFTPPPAVDSAVIAVRNISRSNFDSYTISPQEFFSILHLAFGNKRKQLQGNLNNSKQWSREIVEEALNDSAIPPDARAEDCTLEQLLALTSYLTTHTSS